MEEPPEFFIPNVEHEQQETVYRELAKTFGREIAPPSQRIYSITFLRDRVEWTATVGKTARGRTQAPLAQRPVRSNVLIVAIFGEKTPRPPDGAGVSALLEWQRSWDSRLKLVVEGSWDLDKTLIDSRDVRKLVTFSG